MVSLGLDGCADRQQRPPSSIQGLLPSTSPYDSIDDGPTSVNFDRRDTYGNTTGLSCGLLRFLMMKFHVLGRRLKLIGMNTEHPLFWILWIRHVWFKQVLCNDLSFDLVQCGGIVFSFQLPSFGSSPKTIACFWIFQAGCSWRFMKMALQLPFSLFSCHSSRSSSWRA